MKTLVLGLAVAAFMAFPLDRAAADVDGRTQVFERTCKYFEGVAFNDRHRKPVPSFRVDLADDCADALMLRSSAPAGSVLDVLATAYLDRMEAYKRVLISMARERFLNARTGAGQRPMTMQPVSEAGAFLIAKSMGLTANQTRWREWRQAMAEGRVSIRP